MHRKFVLPGWNGLPARFAGQPVRQPWRTADARVAHKAAPTRIFRPQPQPRLVLIHQARRPRIAADIMKLFLKVAVGTEITVVTLLLPNRAGCFFSLVDFIGRKRFDRVQQFGQWPEDRITFAILFLHTRLDDEMNMIRHYARGNEPIPGIAPVEDAIKSDVTCDVRERPTLKGAEIHDVNRPRLFKMREVAFAVDCPWRCGQVARSNGLVARSTRILQLKPLFQANAQLPLQTAQSPYPTSC